MRKFRIVNRAGKVLQQEEYDGEESRAGQPGSGLYGGSH